MKIFLMSSPSKRTNEDGAALIVTLIFAVAAVVVLGTYLSLVNNDAKGISRSQDWNRALAYAEAGVDEALAQVNASPSNFAANAWGSVGANYGPITRNMANGSYSVSIVGGPAPTIYATGVVNVASSDTQVARVVKVSARQLGLFPVAFAAINLITLNGSGPTSDSYNSHDPNLSTGGLYDPTKTSTNGNVASVQGTVNPGNHIINGSLYLGPTATYAGSDANVTGLIYYDYNVQFQKVTVPQTSWTVAVPVSTTNTVVTYKNNGTISGTKTTITSSYHFTQSGDYQIIGNYPIVVDPGVKANLWVTASTIDLTSLQIHDNGDINNSGTAYIYLDGPSSVTLAGNQAVDASGRPENLWVYGTDKLTSITFSGNGQFTGVIYAPNATVNLNGGGNNSLDVSGSMVVNTITVNGHFALHYDEYLSTLGSRGFIPTAWQELSWAEN